MTVHVPMTEDIRVLRARVERYKQLADVLFDRRTAAEVAEYAEELEAMIAEMESRQQAVAVSPPVMPLHRGGWN